MLDKFDSRKSYSSRSNKSNMMEQFNGTHKLNKKDNRNSLACFNSGGDIFSMHSQMIQQMDKRFEQVHNRMLRNVENTFGTSLMKEFSSPFSMIDQMSKQMDNMFSNFSDMHHNMLQSREQGPFTQMHKVFTMQRKLGPDNKVYEEKYFSNNLAQKDQSGNTISERQQAYKNNLNRRDVIAQERMLNNQGRKYVQERVNGSINSTNHYLNLDENNADMFDSAWNDFNERVGFHKNNSRFLGLGGGVQRLQDNRLNNDNFDDNSSDWSEPVQNKRQQSKIQKRQQNNKKNYKEYDFRDDVRRGDYLPINARSEDQVVRLNNNNFDGYGRRATDLKPTQPQTNNNQNNTTTTTNNNNNNNRPSISAIPQSQTQIPAQVNNNIASNNHIRNNNQQRGSVTLPQRSINPQPMRNAVEQGVFANRNNPKGALPKAG